MSKFIIDKMLSESRYQKREEPWLRTPYEYELILLNMVKLGDVEGIRNSMFHYDMRNHLSSNTLQQRRYELVASVTLFTRMAVEGGLDIETANDLSDAYINAADKTNDINLIVVLVKEASLHFATLVRDNKSKGNHRLPKPVMHCVEYIESHLHTTITMTNLSEYTKYNASYLSTLFHKERGMTISSYILQRKLEEACQLLSDTNIPITQIASILAFSTQSYFSHAFLKIYGETPRQYRKRNFRRRQE